METEIKLCECGCGRPAPIAKVTYQRRGLVKGQPMRFVHGHAASKGYGTNRGKVPPPEYGAYYNARDRCTRPKNSRYKSYGARGIKFLFTSFEQFFAHIGPRPTPEHSLDRIENDGHYEVGNVRWATAIEQANNQRHVNQHTRSTTCQKAV